MKKIFFLLCLVSTITYGQQNAQYDRINVTTYFGGPILDTIATPYKLGEMRTRPQDGQLYRYNGKAIGNVRWDNMYYGPGSSQIPSLDQVLARGNTSSIGINAGSSSFLGLKVPSLGLTGNILMVTVGPDGTFAAQTIPGGGTLINSINALTASAQFLKTSFNIATSPSWNSATATHTLNLPIVTVSADTGLVTPAMATLWTGKFTFPTSGTSAQYINGVGNLVTFPTIPAQLNPTTAGGGITITGTYPNLVFTVSSSGAGITSLTGDVIGSGSGAVGTTITANIVSYSKIQQVTASRLLGNSTGSTANVQELTVGSGVKFISGGITLDSAYTSLAYFRRKDTFSLSDVNTIGRGNKVRDSLGLVKVTNTTGAIILGSGLYSAKPLATAGPGFYFAYPDSSKWFYSNGTIWIPATDKANNIFNLAIRNAGVIGDSIWLKINDTTLNFRILRDSSGSCIHHVIAPDGAIVLYSTCSAGGGSGTTNLLLTQYPKGDSVLSSTGTGVLIDTASTTRLGLMSINDYNILKHPLFFRNDSAVLTSDTLMHANIDTVFMKSIAWGWGIKHSATQKVLYVAADSAAIRTYINATNIYTNDGTLVANRTITMGGKTLLFSGGISTFSTSTGNALTIKSGNQSSIIFTTASGSSGFLLGRSLSSDDAQNFFIYDAVANVNRLAISSTGKVTIPDTLQIQDGTQGAGKVFTSDANGNGSWVSSSAVNFYTTDGTLTGNRTITNSGNNLIISGSGNLGLPTGGIVTSGSVYTGISFGSAIPSGTGIGSSSSFASNSTVGGFQITTGNVAGSGSLICTVTLANTLANTHWHVFLQDNFDNHGLRVYAASVSTTQFQVFLETGSTMSTSSTYGWSYLIVQ